MTRVRLDERSLALLKSHTAGQLPGVQYCHVLEVIARGLGFNTWNAFAAHQKTVVTGDVATAAPVAGLRADPA